jgi:hypothetical protein
MTGSRNGVRELLEVYGAVDIAIKDSDRKEFGVAVDQFLPQYSTHAGWHEELDRFMFPDEPRRTPDVAEALAKIATFDQTDDRLAQPQKARLLFALATIARLNRLVPESPLPKLTTELKDPTIEALAAIGPGSFELAKRRDIASSCFEDFATAVPERFVARNTFTELRQLALGKEMIGAETASAPLCEAAITKVDGFDSVLVDTSFESPTITLNNLKKVVNPYNWNENYPEFFVSMTNDGEAFTSDGWRRVLESVQFFQGFGLQTPLKFLPSEHGPGVAMLDYDLDMSRFESGDGKVRVDRGYINMSSIGAPDEPGVRVQTRKVVHIEGISPFAQQRLVCITGYGTASSDFLLGRAENPAKTAEEFHFPTRKGPIDESLIDDTPISLPRHAVPTAVQIWTDAMVSVTGEYADLAEKWWGGSLSVSDIADFGSRVGGRMASTPLTFLDAMNRSRYRSR